jgi:membrane protease YdiL (CAAX protease family)
MVLKQPPLRSVGWTLSLAFGLWFVTFAVPAGNFWLKLCASATVLALVGLRLSWEERTTLFAFKPRHLWVGLGSALALYGIFWMGKQISGLIFPFAQREISNIYVNKAQLDPLRIGILLFFIMGPAEEIYWHGYVQRTLGLRLGAVRGVLITAVFYTLVHISAFNAMLALAAGLCGLFWGLLYLREKSLIPVIISHSLWDVILFVLFPLN